MTEPVAERTCTHLEHEEGRVRAGGPLFVDDDRVATEVAKDAVVGSRVAV